MLLNCLEGEEAEEKEKKREEKSDEEEGAEEKAESRSDIISSELKIGEKIRQLEFLGDIMSEGVEVPAAEEFIEVALRLEETYRRGREGGWN